MARRYWLSALAIHSIDSQMHHVAKALAMYDCCRHKDANLTSVGGLNSIFLVTGLSFGKKSLVVSLTCTTHPVSCCTASTMLILVIRCLSRPPNTSWCAYSTCDGSTRFSSKMSWPYGNSRMNLQSWSPCTGCQPIAGPTCTNT